MKKKINKNIPKYKFGAAEVGGTLQGLGAGLSAIPTPYTQIAGAALATVGSVWGEDGSVDPNTGEIRKGSGLSKLFGRSNRSLAAESNRIKNSLVDRELTEKLNYNYYNDPNHSVNMNVFAAAEGGTIPGTSEVMLDSREFVVTPDRGKGKRLGYAKGTDTIPAIVPNHTGILSEDVKDTDGISFAEKGDRVDKMLPDNHPLKKILNLKLLNRQEVVKINKINKKKGLPAYKTGISDVTLGRNTLPEMPTKLNKIYVPEQIYVPTEDATVASSESKSKSGIGWDFLNLLGPLANTFGGKSEKVNVYAPRREFGPTYYNERPMVEQALLNRAITNYNAAKITPDAGAGRLFALQSQMNTDKAIGTALANKENIQNQYAFQNANIYNQWSDVYANAKHIAAVEQAQNDAAARNIKRKGVGDLFTNAGKNVRNRYLTKRDEGLYQAMLPDLEYGMTSEQLKKLTELYA